MPNLQVLKWIINIFLIITILLRIPSENIGLASFATKNKFFNSPSFAERFLAILISLAIFIYFGIAIKLNLKIIYGY